MSESEFRFTEQALKIIEHAKHLAVSSNARQLAIEHVLQSLSGIDEHREALERAYPELLQGFLNHFPLPESRHRYQEMLPVSGPLGRLFLEAQHRARQEGGRDRIDASDLLWAACTCPDVGQALRNYLEPVDEKELRKDFSDDPANVSSLVARLQDLRRELLEKVFGQDHAVHAYVDGLFNAEYLAGVDSGRRGPRAIFVFAGPPGVGKTYLATLGAEALDKPFKRFDMSGYAGLEQHVGLTGMQKMYRGARPGDLTGFVADHPDAVLLFDEIEKASPEAIQLFLQLLDAGRLEDKFTEETVSFRDTSVIFTTDAGRSLYDNPNQAGVTAGNSRTHRQTILDALRSETHPQTGRPVFPQAICSRLATGWPILFNHLGVADLCAVAQRELDRVGDLLSLQHPGLRVTYGEDVAACLLLREGLPCDARTLCARSESFVKEELFRLLRLWGGESREKLKTARALRFVVEKDPAQQGSPCKAGPLGPTCSPKVLMVADPELCGLYKRSLGEREGIEWIFASRPDDAIQQVAVEQVDLVLLDILNDSAAAEDHTVQVFGRLVLGARRLRPGLELLRRIHERAPDVPVYLLDFERAAAKGPATLADLRHLDEELLNACVAGGGARGAISTGFEDEGDSEDRRNEFFGRVTEVGRRVVREKEAAALAQQRQVLSFETAPDLSEDGSTIDIRLRNFKRTRALTSADTGSVLGEVERPETRFDDVIGAEDAKKELAFFREYLQDPRRFLAGGVRPPKGVLLHGPPGTGKTLLARALAGESNVAFIPANASSFITIWQGSGPQSIRDLFARARRYAPAIIFIDEIDAVGGTRTGGPSSRAEENTLNALLTEIDGFVSPSPTRPVFVLAATNARIGADEEAVSGRPGKVLDPALVRRFDRKILVALPDHEARLEYLNMKLREEGLSGDDLKPIADRAYGMSLADLEAVVEMALRLAMEAGGRLSFDHLNQALEEVQYGQARPRNPDQKKRTGYHEAGHVMMYHDSGWLPVYATIVSRGSHGGYMAPDPKEAERDGFTLAELNAKIRVLLGGRVAELIQFGDREGLTTGASSDLAKATRIAREMVCRFGMDQEVGPIVLSELTDGLDLHDEALAQRVTEAARGIMAEQLQQTRDRLQKSKDALDCLAGALVERERLTAREIQEILRDPPSPGQE